MLAQSRFPNLCSLQSTSYIGTFSKRTYANVELMEARAARLAPFLVEKVRFVIPLGARHAKASTPRLTSQFYYESKPYTDGNVNLCERRDLPMVREELLDRELNLDLLEGRDAYLKDLRRYKNLSRLVFYVPDWLKWIRAREKILKPGNLPLESLINGRILTSFDVLKIFFIHSLRLKKPIENKEVKYVQIVGQKIAQVYLFYRLIKANEKSVYAAEYQDGIYSGLKMIKEVTQVPKKFQEGYLFTNISWGNFEMRLKMDSKVLPISYFKHITGVNKGGSIIDIHSEFESYRRRSHAYHVNNLKDCISMILSNSTHYLVGIKESRIDKSLGQHILKRVKERLILDMEIPLQAYFKEEDILEPGIQYAYEFFTANMKLLDRYPDGYCTMAYFSIKAREFDIGVYKDDNRGLSFKEIDEMREEYGKR